MGESTYKFEGVASPASTGSWEIPVHSLRKRQNSLQKKEVVAKTRRAGACEKCRRRKVRCTHSNIEVAFSKPSPGRRDRYRDVDPQSIIQVDGSDIFGMKAKCIAPIETKINLDISSLFPSTASNTKTVPVSPYTPSVTFTPDTKLRGRPIQRPLQALSPMQIYSLSGKRQLSNVSVNSSEEAIRPARKKDSWGRAVGKAMLGKIAALNSIRMPSGSGTPRSPYASEEVDIADRMSMCSLESSPTPNTNEFPAGDSMESPRGSPRQWQEDSTFDRSDRTDPRSPSGWMEHLLTPRVGESANSWIQEDEESRMYEDDEAEFVFGLGISTPESAQAGGAFSARTSSLAAKKTDWNGMVAGEELKNGRSKAVQKFEKVLSQKQKKSARGSVMGLFSSAETDL